MSIKLPGAIEKYMQAANAHDSAAVAASFNPTGKVADDGEVHRGHDAILIWSQSSSADLAIRNTVLGFVPTAQGGVVQAEVTGNFPGSPLHLSFSFTIRNDAIDLLEIKP